MAILLLSHDQYWGKGNEVATMGRLWTPAVSQSTHLIKRLTLKVINSASNALEYPGTR